VRVRVRVRVRGAGTYWWRPQHPDLMYCGATTASHRCPFLSPLFRMAPQVMAPHAFFCSALACEPPLQGARLLVAESLSAIPVAVFLTREVIPEAAGLGWLCAGREAVGPWLVVVWDTMMPLTDLTTVVVTTTGLLGCFVEQKPFSHGHGFLHCNFRLVVPWHRGFPLDR